ncbi:MAG: DAK2 domain-containing protein [Geminicoccaceae bacterium]
MTTELLTRLIEAADTTISGHAAQLDALDEAIGDGDHGTNLARGLAVLNEQRQQLAAMPLAQALDHAAVVIEREVGGAGGTFYAALLIGMARAAPAGNPGLADLAAMLRAGVAAVQAKGHARKGEKTLVDVLLPSAQVLDALVAEGRTDQIGARVLAAAAHGLHSTTHMIAKHGLAAALEAASVNRLDAGACSCALLIGACVGVLEQPAQAA